MERITKRCSKCGQSKEIEKNFIKNNNNPDNRDLWCNKCRKSYVVDEQTLIDYCRENNRGYNSDLFKQLLEINKKKLKNKENVSDYNELLIKKTINLYFSKMNLENLEGNKIKNVKQNKNIKITKQELEFLQDKWGIGYKNEEYLAFEKKYQFLKNNYPEKTAMHTEALLNYIRYRVKEEMATARGDVKEAKEWGMLAKQAATDAKINPSQLSAADLSDGLSGFGQLARAVEQAVDIIPILPKFKEKPQDKVDFTLWCYINYIRDSKGLPLCDYKDIYKFYEDRKNEYKDRFDFLKEEEGEK